MKAIPENYLKKLLVSSVMYHQSEPQEIKALPDKFKTKQAAIKAFTKALYYEAHQNFKAKIPNKVDSPLLHAINLDKNRPGIISDITKEKAIKVFREDTSNFKEQNTKLWELRQVAKKANQVVDKMDKRTLKLLEKMAQKEEKAKLKEKAREEAQLEKQLLKQRLKEEREKEREYYRQADKAEKLRIRQERKKRKLEQDKLKQERKNARLMKKEDINILKPIKEQVNPKDTSRTSQDTTPSTPKDTTPSTPQDTTPSTPQDTTPSTPQDTTPSTPQDTPSTPQDTTPLEVDINNPHIKQSKTPDNKPTSNQTVESKTEIIDLVEMGNSIEDKIEIFASPVAHNRHLGALSYVNPHPDLLNTVLNGSPPQKKNTFRMFLGPPGTGKTYRLILELKQLLQKNTHTRFYVCAASNVGTCNLYQRAKSLGVSGSLIMKKEKIASGTYQNASELKSWTPESRVVFATVSSRSSFLLKDQEFQTVLLDEAAQLQEAHFWGLLRPEVNQIYMAGDTNQLPAVVSELGQGLNHGRSIMERLTNLGLPAELLDTQRRMHPHIVAFPNKEFYQGELKTLYKEVKQPVAAFEIIDVKGKEERIGTSYQNKKEVLKIKDAIKELKKNYSNIVVISPYSAQCQLLKKEIPNVDVHTVDSFQGKEADVIILTTVRVGSSVGFWSDYRRLNVALTRAKHVLRVVGNVATWKKTDTSLKNLALFHQDKISYLKN